VDRDGSGGSPRIPGCVAAWGPGGVAGGGAGEIRRKPAMKQRRRLWHRSRKQNSGPVARYFPFYL
jgi:cation transport regulator ChaC